MEGGGPGGHSDGSLHTHQWHTSHKGCHSSAYNGNLMHTSNFLYFSDVAKYGAVLAVCINMVQHAGEFSGSFPGAVRLCIIGHGSLGNGEFHIGL